MLSRRVAMLALVLALVAVPVARASMEELDQELEGARAASTPPPPLSCLCIAHSSNGFFPPLATISSAHPVHVWNFLCAYLPPVRLVVSSARISIPEPPRDLVATLCAILSNSPTVFSVSFLSSLIFVVFPEPLPFPQSRFFALSGLLSFHCMQVYH